MTQHKVDTREEWLAARLELLLDRAPKGRSESGRWYRVHDEYEIEAP
jgi:predicted dithiol-disulfide oxidoreductase (DUF899 family)